MDSEAEQKVLQTLDPYAFFFSNLFWPQPFSVTALSDKCDDDQKIILHHCEGNERTNKKPEKQAATAHSQSNHPEGERSTAEQRDTEDLHTRRGKHTGVRRRPAVEKTLQQEHEANKTLDNAEIKQRVSKSTGVITERDITIWHWSGGETRLL